MFYAVVIDNMETFYVCADSDDEAVSLAQEFANKMSASLRIVFVSAHNDPANGPTGMREVFRRDS